VAIIIISAVWECTSLRERHRCQRKWNLRLLSFDLLRDEMRDEKHEEIRRLSSSLIATVLFELCGGTC